MNMTYKETVEYIYSQLPAYHRIGKPAYKADLKNTILLDEYFGHPHRKFKSVHIAGTNGKGSVSHMLASVLQTAGCRTGLYTSPHLKDFRERIKVNGKMIPEKEVTGFIDKNRELIEKLKPSFFEITVAMAFVYFAQEDVDVAVVETGMGGRLDSTNIITPVLSVITNIGHDHIEFLGDTLQKIAGEKAGIIKERIPVIIGETQEETAEVFTSKAKETESEIIFADIEYQCVPEKFDPNSEIRKFILKHIRTGREFVVKSPLAGDYQAKNIPVVMAASMKLNSYFKINNEEIVLTGIKDVVKNTGFAGRWQILGHRPLIICDTGHNREGLEQVISQLMEIPAEQKHIVLGFVKDKDLESILPLFPKEARYYFTRATVERALDENLLREKALNYGLNGNAYASVPEAFEKAKSSASGDDLIFIGGSTFVVADLQ